jgi:hypothetical protein
VLHCTEPGTVGTIVALTLSVRLCVGEWLEEDDFEFKGAVKVLTSVTLTVVVLALSARLFGIGEWLMGDDFGAEGIVNVLTPVADECFGIKVDGKESSRLVKLVWVAGVYDRAVDVALVLLVATVAETEIVAAVPPTALDVALDDGRGGQA